MKHLKDTFTEVFLYMRQHKSRTFMTMFGLIWGTTTIVLLLSFGTGVEKAMKKNMHGMGDGIAIMWPGTTTKAYEGYNRGRRIRFRRKDVDILRQRIDEFDAISPEYISYGVPIRVDKTVNKTAVTGIIPQYGSMRNCIARAGGRWINELDVKDRRRVAFIGYKLSALLFGEHVDPVGEYIMVRQTPFLVVGWLKEKTQPSSYATRDHDRVFIPATTFESVFGHRYLNDIVYKVKDPTRNEIIKEKIYEVFGRHFMFDPTDKNALGIWDTTEQDKFIHYFTLGFKIFLGLIGTITLVVGGIGLANIMYVVVQERTREIGIKRSIGAKRHTIMGQFIFEAFIIIGIGAIIGFLIALALIQIIASFPIEDYVGTPEVTWSVVIPAILVLCLVGFSAGFFPARRASRLDVIECLRY